MFTFKTEKPTGRYRSFFQSSHYIKIKRFEVGCIEPEEPFKIKFMIIKADIMEDGNKNCCWKWITLKKESKTLEEAKEFLNKNFDAITTKFKLITPETENHSTEVTSKVENIAP